MIASIFPAARHLHQEIYKRRQVPDCCITINHLEILCSFSRQSLMMVQITQFILATAALAAAASAAPKPPSNAPVNPWPGKDRYVVQSYGKKLDQTIASFKAQGDTLNADRTRTVAKKISTFTWVTTRSGLSQISTAIKEARRQKKSNKKMIVGLVLYNLPDRDCSAGESAGELSIANDGLSKCICTKRL
jgi:cellulose 1,4-beta-cellobiosidase